MITALDYSEMLHLFICEMEHTLTDKIKANRNYAPQVFWKNKYTLECIVDELKNYSELQNDYCKVVEQRGKWQKNFEEKLKVLKIIESKVLEMMEIRDLIEFQLPTKDAVLIYNGNKGGDFQITEEEFNLIKKFLYKELQSIPRDSKGRFISSKNLKK